MDDLEIFGFDSIRIRDEFAKLL